MEVKKYLMKKIVIEIIVKDSDLKIFLLFSTKISN